MIAFALISAALAEEPKVLQVKVLGPGAVVAYEATLTLPVDTQEATVEIGGVPYVVSVLTSNRHDTVVVETVIYELHGKKQKRKEVSRPKLILYEDYPGHVAQPVAVPRGYSGTPPEPFEWTLEAEWDLPAAQ